MLFCYSVFCQTVWVYTAGLDQGPNGLPRLSADDKIHGERQSDQRLCYSHQCQTVNRQNVDQTAYQGYKQTTKVAVSKE